MSKKDIVLAAVFLAGSFLMFLGVVLHKEAAGEESAWLGILCPALIVLGALAMFVALWIGNKRWQGRTFRYGGGKE